MTNRKKHLANLLTGAGLGILNLVIGVFVGLFLTPFLIRTLGDRHYAINTVVAGFVGCFAMLDLGITSAVSRYFTLHFARNEKRDCLEIANTAFTLFTVIGLVSYLLIVTIGAGIFVLYPEMEDRGLIYRVILINGLAFSLNFPLTAFTGVVNGSMRQELTGSRDIVMRLLGVFAIVVVLLAGGRLQAMAWTNLLMVFINTVVIYRLVRVAFPDFKLSRIYFKRPILRKLFSFGIFTFLVSVGDIINAQGGKFVLASMINLETVAPYSAVSVNLIEYFLNIMMVVGGGWLISWFTYLYAEGDKDLLDVSLRLAYKLCVFSATFMLFGLVVWGPDFIVRWMGEPYMVAYPSLVILAVATWQTQSQAPNTRLLFAMAKHPILSYLSVAGSVVNILLSIFFVYHGWGINGVALSALIVQVVVRGIMIPIYVNRLLNRSIVLYYLRLAGYAAVAAVACILPYLISRYFLAPKYPNLFLVGFLSAATYVPVVYTLGLSRDEKAKIKSFVFSKLQGSSPPVE